MTGRVTMRPMARTIGAFRAAGIVCAAWALAGCSGGLLTSDLPPPETYQLGARSAPAAVVAAAVATRTSPLGLTVARPRSAAALDSERIAVASGGNRFDYYAGVRWVEPAPQMLQQNLVAALARSGLFAGVFAAPARVPAELTLDVELRRFEADTTAGETPVVHVALQASLVDARRALRVATFTSAADVAAGSDKRAAIIAAFDRANAQVVDDVVARVAAAAATVPAN
jgi:cholesterol transport system auxiliary component